MANVDVEMGEASSSAPRKYGDLSQSGSSGAKKRFEVKKGELLADCGMSDFSTDPVVRTVISVALVLTVIGCGGIVLSYYWLFGNRRRAQVATSTPRPQNNRNASQLQTQIDEQMRRNNSLYNLPAYAEAAPSYKNSVTPAPVYGDELPSSHEDENITPHTFA
ncbi:hypothetical protein HDU84_002528 [Entophlyctis sp. JEL0112]|nr:hypothetical protein HDU84_002528 [Entophlyctis sp. JEL0112]